MANLKRGSTGEEVAEVQRIVGVKDDGIFGPDTEAAVKQYQKNNGLAADGIVGPDTRGVMFKTTKTNTGGNTGTKPATPSGAAPVTPPGGVTYGDFTYDSFDPGSSETIQQAQTLLDQNNANRPGAWVDPYQSQYMDYLNQYANRDPFSYDFNSDALYQQYRDNYILQGQMAMMDTMGQAAAMTGGYGNSYAQSVGQQAYNQHLNQLNDIIPELYGMAYDRYQQEGQDLLNMYNIYKGLSDDSYGRHQDDVDNWYREDTRLTNNYNTAYGQEWDKYSLGYDTAWSEYLTDRSESKNTTGGTGASGVKLEHVATMSSYDLVGYLQNYQKRGDNTGLAAFLDDCEATGRLTREQVDNYYAEYRTGTDDVTVDTTVDPLKEEQAKRRGAGRGSNGRSAVVQMIK